MLQVSFNLNDTSLSLHIFIYILICRYCHSSISCFHFSSNKHRCSHTLTLIFKHLSFYESGEIYPLLSLSLPSAARTEPLAHFFIVFSLFLQPPTHSPLHLCVKSCFCPSATSVSSCMLPNIHPRSPKRYSLCRCFFMYLDFSLSLFCSTSLTLWLCLKTR